ncbi:TPA: hypothetical protein N0F65_007252 [Lagenidium giganteum]|uniref:Chromo domain-containing protein n=1 Tax=Lagenidium giganteum TaxID=4803 RepID=A0AAV2YX76_9STRA|nr:TPA: hypothetical protein N0F65_007252 [Lagenidium giganteum]
MKPPKRTRRPREETTELVEFERIDDRRGEPGQYEYHVVWSRDSSDWLTHDQLIEDGNVEAVETVDRYLSKHPDRQVSFQQFVSEDAHALYALGANDDNSCVAHAIQMAFELLGLHEPSRKLPSIWTKYREDAEKCGIDYSNGMAKATQLFRYCRVGVPDSGYSIHLKTLKQNLFDGDGAGYVAIAKRAISTPPILTPGVYLVGANQRNMRGHCFALLVTTDTRLIVRENGHNSGLREHLWFRTIQFIRRFVAFPNDMVGHYTGKSRPHPGSNSGPQAFPVKP